MEEALQSAIARMSKQESSNGGANPLNLLMAILPKLLANNEEREDLVEKIEGLEKDSLAPLQEQIHGLRKQVHRAMKMQAAIIEELRELRDQQTAVGNAVLHLAQQMSRVGIVEGSYEDDEFDEPAPPPRPARPQPSKPVYKKRRGSP
jgi:superfamily II RNA helicase